ncbi:MAG: hypothetical protein Q7V20_11480 [Aquabacterium sp.]|uniref:hypothetical protein n=1 Tax=Aquabacterium sp. TaxID=1872578 RepID=UPI0027223815|nr:hypothetical protein [Aquabacterium sp.]MDO9004066.1 hypothetical protein [Aquabacterium sp.]
MSVTPSNNVFMTLVRAFFVSGGTVRAEELERQLQERQRGDYISLARLMASGKVFFFEWRDAFWVPMFQFDPQNLSVKSTFERIRDELTPQLNGWQLAQWFAMPNVCLGNRRPADVLDLDFASVLAAARQDRGLAH